MANEERKSMSLVKAKDAKPLSLRVNPIWRTREIQIWWPVDNLVLAEDAIRYLNKCTSTLNGQEELSYVDNPYYGTEQLEGRFRNVTAQLTKHEQKPAIVQTLRENWITVLPTKEADDDEVRLSAEGTGADPFTGDTSIMRYWGNIDPDYAEDILTVRKATKTVTNPQVDIWDKLELRRSKKVYTGKFAVTRLMLNGQEDGAKQLTEGLLEIHSVDTVTDLLTLNPRLTQENEIYDIFGPNPAPGEGDSLGFTFYNIDPESRPFLMDATTDANLVTYIAQKGGAAWATATDYVECDVRTSEGNFYICVVAHTSGTFATDLAEGKWTAWHDWVYASKKFIEQEDNTGRFHILFREVTWESWGHDNYAFDSISYGNAGVANISESKSKRYVGITVDDIDVAVASLRENSNWIAWATTTAYVLNAQVTNTGKKYICAIAHTSDTFSTDLAAGKWVEESGFIQIDVNVDFNPQNGSCSFVQTIIEQIDDEDEDGNIVLNPHSLSPGTAVIQTTNFRNFTAATLPAGDSIGGDIISNIEMIQSNGLWSREVKTRTPTWTNTWAFAIKMSESDIGGYQLSEMRQATGVPEAGRAAAFTAAQTASAATRVVVDTAQQESGDGERIIRSMEKLLNTDGSREPDRVKEVQVTIQGSNRQVQRIWYRNSATAVTTLTEPGAGKAAKDFSYTTEAGAVTFTHKAWSETDHGDGAYTITQVGVTTTIKTWISRNDTDGLILIAAHEIAVRKSGENIYEAKLRCHFRQIFTTQQAAANFVTSTVPAEQKIIDFEKGDVELRQGFVKYEGDARWSANVVLIRDIGTNPIWNVANP